MTDLQKLEGLVRDAKLDVEIARLALDSLVGDSSEWNSDLEATVESYQRHVRSLDTAQRLLMNMREEQGRKQWREAVEREHALYGVSA